MPETLELEIVTPDRLVVKAQVEEVQIPGSNGYLGVLPGHAPLITELSVGEVSYKAGNDSQHLSLAWGFAEVLPHKVTILAETAERAADIDVARAENARERAERALQQAQSGEEYELASAALLRAQNRLQVASKNGN